MATLLLRLSLGMLFFVAALGKFLAPIGVTGVSQKLMEGFQGTWLPMFLVAPYTYALPYLEITVGSLLILGLFTRCAFMFSGLLLISLAFGMMVKQDPATVAHNLNYVLMVVAGIWFSARENPLSVDGLICRDKTSC
jgi:thiosulfate dehydrogenase [quinone] large subunit